MPRSASGINTASIQLPSVISSNHLREPSSERLSETTFGKLMHDRELYDNINQAAANIEELSRSLRPVVNDARVFTDKIARHPELLGVRGAMQRNTGTKGVPAYPTLR